MPRFKPGDTVIVREREPDSLPSTWTFSQGIVRRDADYSGYYISVDGIVAVYSFYDVKRYDALHMINLRGYARKVDQAQTELRDEWERC